MAEAAPKLPPEEITYRRELRGLPGGKKEEEIEDKKETKPAAAAGGRRKRILKTTAYASIPFLLGGAGAAIYYIQEKNQGGDQVTQNEQGETIVTITPETTTAPTTAVETVPPTTETAPETTAEIEKVNAPEIKGINFNLTFNQKDKTYLNEVGDVVGAWIESAAMINGKLGPAIVLKPEIINKILAENKEKGIFKCVWPIDFKENKEKGIEIEIVELSQSSLYEQETYEKNGIYVPSPIAIKFTEPINFYAPFDANNEAPKVVNKLTPDKEGSSNFFSAQGFKNLVLFSAIGYESKEIEGKRYGSIQYNFIDWKPSVVLGESYELGNDGYGQDMIGEIRAGDLLGEILSNTPDFDFLDFADNPDFFENPGQFQGVLSVFDFWDDFSQPTSSLEKTLSYTREDGQEVPVGVFSGRNDSAHEQTN